MDVIKQFFSVVFGTVLDAQKKATQFAANFTAQGTGIQNMFDVNQLNQQSSSEQQLKDIEAKLKQQQLAYEIGAVVFGIIIIATAFLLISILDKK